MTIYARLEEHRLDPAAELEAITRVAGGDGAIVSFVVSDARDAMGGG